MYIKGLTPLLTTDLKPHSLKNSRVVIDGQSLFFSMYKNANLPYAFGCESDRFAKYVKGYLSKFKNANLDCYFVFKGGHEDKKALNRHFEDDGRLHGRNYSPGEEYDDIVQPIFAKDIWFQVLNEMGFKYFVICKGDHNSECIALALKLSCPLVGNNMQYFFSQVQYIPERNTVLDENNNLVCGVYTLSDVLSQYRLPEENLLLFIMLADKHVFKENVFEKFFKTHKLLTRNDTVNYRNLFKWLSQRSKEVALKDVFTFLSDSEEESFQEKMKVLEKLTLERKNSNTKMTLFVTDENEAKFTQADPDWFEKGIFFNKIAIPYVNLYRYKIVEASKFIEDYEQENSIMLSIDIVKYAFDLLTNFEGGEMIVEHKISASDHGKDQPLKYDLSVRKPEYEASISVFENGWEDIKRLHLFEHFITESLQTFDFARLNRAPEDCRLLIIALVYFSRKKPDVKLEIHSILLSYVMLGIVSEKLILGSNSNAGSVSEKPFLDPITDKNLVTETDCDIAWSLMSKYFDLRRDELCFMFDRVALHPLVQFQRCLEELNYLNTLCGSPFEPTIYSKTYNGTFVYKVLHSMRDSRFSEDGLEFIKEKLCPAPTVLAFLTGIYEIYESILYEY